MGFGVSFLLIAAGAILAWAVHRSPSGFDVNTVGMGSLGKCKRAGQLADLVQCPQARIDKQRSGFREARDIPVDG